MLTEFPLTWLPALGCRFLFLLRSQRWDAEKTGRYADHRLRLLVRHAARHVPYYRELFRSIGLDPEGFRGRCDLHRIPFLEKDVLRTRADELVADNAERFQPIWHHTSGSTGTPVRFMVDRGVRIHDAAATLRAYLWAGFFPGRKVFSLKFYMLGWAYRYSMAGRALNADTMQLGPETANDLWRELNRLKPGFFHGYPFALVTLAMLGRKAGTARHNPHTILSVAESLPPSVRRRLSELYGGARVFDIYSMTENCVMITECSAGTRHVLDDYAWHELVDADGNPMDAGRGELVGTGYYNYAMPLIRYRTRDWAHWATDRGPCPCGRPSRSIGAIEGRKEDMVQTPDGRVINLFEDPFNLTRGVLAGQYIQDAPDHMTVNILPAPDFDPDSLKDMERDLVERVGEKMRITCRVVDELERRPGDSGKIPFVISRIGNSLYSAGDFSEPGQGDEGVA
jgi:phenylacetate-CoA ligase